MAKKRSGYQGNTKLNAANEKIKITPEQILEIIKCTNDPIYFIKKYIYIINLDDGLTKFNLYDYQEDLINLLDTNLRLIGKMPRQVGKSVTVAAYICHYIIFNNYKTAAILANKNSTAKEILGKIKLMIESLPHWLKPGVLEWNKNSIEFDNGSRIISAATSSSAVRSFSINLLLLDEFAFISEGVFEDFIQSVYPTISSSKNSKIVMISTPQGMNHFYKFWHDAETGKNGYTLKEIKWDDVPGRDEAWKEKMISEIGIDRWNQEFEAKFLGSVNTLIEPEVLRNLVYEDPILEQFNKKLKIYHNPEKHHVYMLISDVGEGVGATGDSSTIQVIDVTTFPHKQVATYRDNTIKARVFSVAIAKIGNLYNEGLVIIENNTIGAEVLNNLNYNEEYDNIFILGDKFGIRMTKGSKSMGCSQLKEIIESQRLTINDFNTIQEFTTFTRNKNGTYSAYKKKHDDLVTPLILYSYFMSKEDLVEQWLEQDFSIGNIHRGAMKEIEEELLPVGFFPDHYNNNDEIFN